MIIIILTALSNLVSMFFSLFTPHSSHQQSFNFFLSPGNNQSLHNFFFFH